MAAPLLAQVATNEGVQKTARSSMKLTVFLIVFCCCMCVCCCCFCYMKMRGELFTSNLANVPGKQQGIQLALVNVDKSEEKENVNENVFIPDVQLPVPQTKVPYVPSPHGEGEHVFEPQGIEYMSSLHVPQVDWVKTFSDKLKSFGKVIPPNHQQPSPHTVSSGITPDGFEQDMQYFSANGDHVWVDEVQTPYGNKLVPKILNN